jgi:hypothetical protein
MCCRDILLDFQVTSTAVDKMDLACFLEHDEPRHFIECYYDDDAHSLMHANTWLCVNLCYTPTGWVALSMSLTMGHNDGNCPVHSVHSTDLLTETSKILAELKCKTKAALFERYPVPFAMYNLIGYDVGDTSFLHRIVWDPSRPDDFVDILTEYIPAEPASERILALSGVPPWKKPSMSRVMLYLERFAPELFQTCKDKFGVIEYERVPPALPAPSVAMPPRVQVAPWSVPRAVLA